MRHLTECVIVTSPEDNATKEVVRSVPGARLIETDAFTRHGASFNKGLALEEGFDCLGRHGWIVIYDADVLFPDLLPYNRFRPDCINGCRRRILADPSKWFPDLNWTMCPFLRDGGPVGYFQLFHADDPAIRDKRPWYDVSFGYAGGGDAYFITLWDGSHRKVHPFDVLHLGERDRNWFGVDPDSRDLMSAFVVRNGWTRPRLKTDPSADKRVGEIRERVQVPGYAPSGFELPFVRRAQANRKS